MSGGSGAAAASAVATAPPPASATGSVSMEMPDRCDVGMGLQPMKKNTTHDQLAARIFDATGSPTISR